jgi:hypothetical protein
MSERVIGGIRQASKSMVRDAERIAISPGQTIDDLKRQVALLAKLLVEVAHHCEDTEKALGTLTKTVVFKGQK